MQDVAHIEFVPNPAQVKRCTSKDQGGAAGNDQQFLQSAEYADNVVDHPLGEIGIGLVFLQCAERKHRQGGTVFGRGLTRTSVGYSGADLSGKARHPHPGAAGGRADAVDGDRIPDVLETLLAEEFVAGGDDSSGLLEHGTGEADAAGLGNLFQASSNIYRRASGAALLQEQLPGIDANPEEDPLAGGELPVALAGFHLQPKAAFQCLDRAGELGHQAIARKTEYAAMRFLDFAAKPAELRSNSSVRLLLVALHQCAIAHDVRAQNCGQPALEPSPT